MIYLDYSANTPADESVLNTFIKTEHEFISNPNSNHEGGIKAREKMSRTVEKTAELLNVLPSEIIFTSGASEANNTAIKSIAKAARHIGKHIITSPLEHSSVSGSLTYLQETGYEIDILKINSDGKIDLNNLKELLNKNTVLLAITAVDSELGVIQPIEEIKEILKDFPDCRLHVDATQAIGKIKFSFSGIDTAAFAPHKFYGLNGVGVLYKKNKLILEPLIHGGASTTVYRSGTPALSLAVSAETALSLAIKNFDKRFERVKKLNNDLREFFSGFDCVTVNSPADAVPHILNISVNGVKATVFQRMLSEKGVYVSVKSACSSDGTPSRAVYEISKSRKNALSSWRISLSHLTTDEEISEFKMIFKNYIDEIFKNTEKK